MKLHQLPQRSEEWHRLRSGRVGASEARAVLSMVKTGESAGRRDLRTLKALERLTGVPAGSDYSNADMERGVALEDDAIWAYSIKTCQIVKTCGYVTPQELS
jgi:hypothetical protein